MKDKGIIFLMVFVIIVTLAAIPVIVNDAVKGQGFFMPTATYRDYVSQGK